MLSQEKTIIRGAAVISMDARIGNLPNADVLIQGTKIVAVQSSITDDHARIIHGDGMILIPGFVDAHRHAWQGTLRRLMPDVSDLMAYVERIHFDLACRYRPEDIYAGNLLTAWSAIDHGITTMIDASHNTRSYAHAVAAVEALETAGIRALYAPGFPLGGDWDQSFRTKGLEQLQKDRFTGTGLVQLGIFSHMSTEHWGVARRLGVPVITEFLGADLSRALTSLAATGQLGPDNIFNHCTGLTEEAWRIIRDHGIKVTVDPRSDAQYGLEEGVFAYQHAIDHGIAPGIGTDLETAYGGDMFTEMRVAFSLQRAFTQNRRFKGEVAPSPVTSQALLKAATSDGADIAGFGKQAGSITPGKDADLVLIDTNAVNLFPANDAIGTVVHAADRSNIHTVMIAGRILKSNGKLVGVDIGSLRSKAEGSVAYLLGEPQ